MRRRFRLGNAGDGPNDPWFRIGTLDVTTPIAVVILTVAAWVVFAVEPIDKPIMRSLALLPWDVAEGQVWRVLTWPFSYPSIDIWAVIDLALFWYFGTDLERNLLGRSRFLRMIVWMTVALGALLMAMYLLIPPFSAVLVGLATLELMVLLAWIAEWPTRMFFFNIPAWLLGVVIVGLQVLQMVGYRDWWNLLHFLVGILVCAFIARHYGMFSESKVVPQVRRPRREPKVRRRRRGRTFDTSRPTVVTGPWEPPAVSRDEARMNALLDKIHAEGQAALTDKERKELLELRDRLRRPR